MRKKTEYERMREAIQSMQEEVSVYHICRALYIRLGESGNNEVKHGQIITAYQSFLKPSTTPLCAFGLVSFNPEPAFFWAGPSLDLGLMHWELRSGQCGLAACHLTRDFIILKFSCRTYLQSRHKSEAINQNDWRGYTYTPMSHDHDILNECALTLKFQRIKYAQRMKNSVLITIETMSRGTNVPPTK